MFNFWSVRCGKGLQVVLQQACPEVWPRALFLRPEQLHRGTPQWVAHHSGQGVTRVPEIQVRLLGSQTLLVMQASWQGSCGVSRRRLFNGSTLFATLWRVSKHGTSTPPHWMEPHLQEKVQHIVRESPGGGLEGSPLSARSALEGMAAARQTLEHKFRPPPHR